MEESPGLRREIAEEDVQGPHIRAPRIYRSISTSTSPLNEKKGRRKERNNKVNKEIKKEVRFLRKIWRVKRQEKKNEEIDGIHFFLTPHKEEVDQSVNTCAINMPQKRKCRQYLNQKAIPKRLLDLLS